ncbi:MAG: site-specific integrase [Candidatus Anammoximicrobium sp.]|nr:site-specific integrase [Candidatus Anammoximicrobium sp.]
MRRRNANRIGRIVSKLGEKAGVQTSDTGCATAHDFRRSFGTRWASRVTPPELQQLMRHRSITTTMSYYVRLDSSELAAKIAGKVNDLVNDPPQRPLATDTLPMSNNEKTRCRATGYKAEGTGVEPATGKAGI